MNRAENIIIPVACSEGVAISNFSIHDNCALGHLDLNQVERQGNYKPKNTEIVPTFTVDEVVKHIGIFPDVLKIDVEGAELQVLRGASKTFIETKPTILLAVHSSDLQSACINYLKDIGYVFEKVCDDGHGDIELLARKV